ncbi:hypothetical protein [Alicyclobacillus macrosporangiidus]|nr:hypothetical protein [Alicyclobacillus macrosporangiidus]
MTRKGAARAWLSLWLICGGLAGCTAQGTGSNNATSGAGGQNAAEQTTNGQAVVETAGGATKGTVADSKDVVNPDVIRRHYAENHLNVVKIQPYPQFHGELVTYSYGDPTIPDRWDWWGEDGKPYPLPTSKYFTTLMEVRDDTDILLMATGENDIDASVDFPFVMHCYRMDAKSPFFEVDEPYYAPLNQPESFGDKKTERLSEVRLTVDGLQAAFAPAPGKESSFWAGATGIPDTKTSYDKSSGEMAIRFLNTALALDPKRLAGEQNEFIRSVSVKTDGADTVLHVRLKPEVGWYTAKRMWVAESQFRLPYVWFTFAENRPDL